MSRKLRIAYFTTRYPSVSHTFIRRELREIERRGHMVYRYALRPPQYPLVDPVDREEANRTIYCLNQSILEYLISFLEVLFHSPLKLFRSLLICVQMSAHSERGLTIHFAYLVEACTLIKLMKPYRIEHIHVHFGTNVTIVARLVKSLGGPSYSFTVHGPAEFDAPVSLDLKGNIQAAEFVVAISHFCSAQLKRWSNPVDWEKIQIVRCTVEDDFFDRYTLLQASANTFVCVGRLSAQKGQLILVNAFEKIIKLGYTAKLIFVGDGELRDLLETHIAAKKIDKFVSITGFVSEEEVCKYLNESLILVLPSFAEGLPMVIMESFAVGRSVISTYIAGIPELVKNGENGWLVPSGNIEELVLAMEQALNSSKKELDRMAENGRELTKANHTTGKEGTLLEQLFLKHIKDN